MGGEHLNRMRIILTLMFIPICVFLSFSEQILLFLGQDSQVSSVAALYIIYQLPGLYMYSLFDALRLFMNALEETT